MQVCFECEKQVEPIKKENIEKVTIHGVDINVELDRYYCPECGELMSDGDLEDENTRRIKQAYYNRTGILSNKDIEDKLLNRYGLSAKSLSDLLGWGEATIQRYRSGAVPNVEYGKTLSSLINPLSMERLLSENLNKLSDMAYRKVYSKILDVYKESEYRVVSALDLSKYYVGMCDFENLLPSKIWVQKLLYFTQLWHLKLFGAPAYLDRIEAWTYGPVVRDVYNRMSDWIDNCYPTKVFINESKSFKIDVNEDQLCLFEEIFNEYGQYQAAKLVSMSHDKVWTEARAKGENMEMTRFEIYSKYEHIDDFCVINGIDDIKNFILIQEKWKG